MENLLKLVKVKMVQRGRDDFTNYLAEILEISKQSASLRMTGKTPLDFNELRKLNAVLNFDGNELKTVLEREECESI